MSPLFRKSVEKVAQEAAGLAELERLRGLGANDLALAILPALGPDGIAHARAGVRPQHLCDWLTASFPGAFKFNPLQLLLPVRDGRQRLEHANLVSSSSLDRASLWRLTSLGETALADGTARTYLAGPTGP
jgi:hypothetical protein